MTRGQRSSGRSSPSWPSPAPISTTGPLPTDGKIFPGAIAVVIAVEGNEQTVIAQRPGALWLLVEFLRQIGSNAAVQVGDRRKIDVARAGVLRAVVPARRAGDVDVLGEVVLLDVRVDEIGTAVVEHVADDAGHVALQRHAHAVRHDAPLF